MAKKVLVTGGSGLLGRALLSERRSSSDSFLFINSKYDLCDKSVCKEVFDIVKPTHVIHLAAKVGGLGANINEPAYFYYKNILMNTNVLHESYLSGVDKVISMLSTCIYPNNCEYPLLEKNIHNGPPHDSNFTYAYAKRMLHVQSMGYAKQYGCNFVCAVPNNLFGEGDNYKVNESHVIPAITRKIWEAKKENKPCELWGTGSPLREFTYSKDIARILLWMLDHYNDVEIPLNIGNTNEISIKDLSLKIKQMLCYDKPILWDNTKPDGQMRKPSDNSRFIINYRDSMKRDFKYSNFDFALSETIKWFKDPNNKKRI